MTYNEQIKAINAEIKKEKKERKEWNEKALHHFRQSTRESAQEIVDMCDARIEKLTRKRESLANAATRGIFA